jgi:hypothetical protein
MRDLLGEIPERHLPELAEKVFEESIKRHEAADNTALKVLRKFMPLLYAEGDWEEEMVAAAASRLDRLLMRDKTAHLAVMLLPGPIYSGLAARNQEKVVAILVEQSGKGESVEGDLEDVRLELHYLFAWLGTSGQERILTALQEKLKSGEKEASWALNSASQLADKLNKAQLRSIARGAAGAIAQHNQRGIANYAVRLAEDRTRRFTKSGLRAALVAALREVENKSLPGADLVKDTLVRLGQTPKDPPEA